MSVDKNRIIEVQNVGRFAVFGKAPYSVIELPNENTSLWGFIIVSDEVLDKVSLDAVGKFNAIYKLNEKNEPVAKLLIKDRDMADDIVFAANRLRI